MTTLHKPVQWKGVVALQRVKDSDQVMVMSAKTQELGARAIKCELPLAAVQKYFSMNEEFACAYAEFGGGHLQLYEKVPSPMFFKHQEQFIH
jgi:hypothetical protein